MLTGSYQTASNSFAPSNIIGVVLCGGGSTRMGSDKGLLQQAGRTWAELAASKLAILEIPVVVSVNKQQHIAYTKHFTTEQLIADSGNLSVKGPLLGILSTHLIFPHKDLLVFACDMKEMTSALLRNLAERFLKDAPEAMVYTTESKVQPLCGVYKADGLRRIYETLQAGNLKKFSVMHVLETLNTTYIKAAKEDLPFFTNYNRPGEL